MPSRTDKRACPLPMKSDKKSWPRVEKFKAAGVTPQLAVVLVGDDEASVCVRPFQGKGLEINSASRCNLRSRTVPPLKRKFWI